MAIATIAKFQILVNGIYGWGKGWLNPDYPARWNSMVRENGELFPYGTIFVDSNSGRSEQYVGSDYDVYLHPMEIVGKKVFSHYCVSDNECDNAGKSLLADLQRLVDAIKGAFPEIEIKTQITIKCYKVETDSPTYVVKG